MKFRFKNKSAKSITTALIAAAGTFLSQESFAFSTFDCAGRNSQKWRGDESEDFLISKNSFPAGSSDRQIIETAFQDWTDVRGSNFKFNFRGHNNADGEFKVLDGKNEVMYVTPRTLLEISDDPDTAGIAINRRFGCRLIESDVIISNEATSADVAGIAAHEFGHALGLDHTNDYGTMLPSMAVSDLAHAGVHPYKPLPDDRQGLRHLYPSSSTERDVGASDMIANIDHLAHTASSYRTFSNMCPGDAIIPIITTLNYGNQSEEFQTRFFASTFLSYDSFAMEEYTTSIGPHRDYTRGLALTVPMGLSPGEIYKVYQYVDYDRSISEHDESNNIELVTRLSVDDPSDCGASYATLARESDRQRESSASLQRTLITYEQALADYQQTVARSVSRLKLSDQYKASTGIYVAKVTSIRPFRGTDGQTLYSEINLSIQETLRGSPVNTLSLRQLGGTIGDESLWIEGAPQLNANDEIIAVVGKNGRSLIPFVGGEKGVLRIKSTPNGKIVLSSSGKEIVGFDGQGFELSRKPGAQIETLVFRDGDRTPNGSSAEIRLTDVLAGIQHKAPLALEEVIDAIRRDLQQQGNLPIPSYSRIKAGAVGFKEASKN